LTAALPQRATATVQCRIMPNEINDFYSTVEFTYRLMKQLSKAS
jgi:hypothetical protein